ncbi:PKD-like domain-containing protein, partial [Flavobacterium fluviatile]|uniref:PKD-like domain-containing protein n=1 Tax=Flavobacterium fluviatile TaxID=1862387 RepID=UPI003137A40D
SSAINVTYVLTPKSASGCSGTPYNLVVAVNPTPAPPTIGTITHLNCTTSTGSVVLENLPGGSWTIASTPSTVLTSGSGTTTTISGLSAGIYTFTVTNSNGCPSGFSSTVTIFDNFNTWNGSSWSRGVPPNASMNVIIDAVTPDSPFAADLTACALTINTGVVATVPSGRTLTITNEVTVNGSLTFENNASLVQINNASVNSGSIIYKRSSQPMKRYDFTYWSSPV